MKVEFECSVPDVLELTASDEIVATVTADTAKDDTGQWVTDVQKVVVRDPLADQLVNIKEHFSSQQLEAIASQAEEQAQVEIEATADVGCDDGPRWDLS